ncbi:MAG: UDP-2,3-diacylglucosamine diphosphatase [Gammaproteobacteria bacterium]|nr:UDP-2,3-diacylglucosamine diphosphatase [Gammaproteobacteria bacterium]
MTTLFISDLHLAGDRPNITELFIDFLGGRARNAKALYILGDLFEAWLGDDMILPEYQKAIAAMKALSDSGVALYLMHGNRDFLMGEKLAELTGSILLDDPCVIDLEGTPTLIMHGDTLCTDDVEYMKFRSMVRNPDWQAQMLAKTPEERLALAKQLREVSKQETGNKAEAIMDVNQQEVERVFTQHNVSQLIHGHTHRPNIHELTINNQATKRIVLGDWYEQGSVLECNNGDCQLKGIPK